MNTLISAKEAREESEKNKLRLILEAEDSEQFYKVTEIEKKWANTLMIEAWAKGHVPAHLRAISRLIKKEITSSSPSDNVLFYTICKDGEKSEALVRMLCAELKDKGYCAEYNKHPTDECYYQLEISW